MDEVDLLLREAEDQIEAWLCELDVEWRRILATARADAARIVTDAHIEASHVVADAHYQAAAVIADAEEKVAKAEVDATALLAGAARLARMQLEESTIEVREARQLTEAVAATPQLGEQDLAALRTAVERLRTELSRVVDAAFDALPAVEATAAALRLDIDDLGPEWRSPSVEPRRGFFRRLLRR